jgi:hypothetical protein
MVEALKVVYVPGPPRVDRDKGLELAERWLQREAPNARDVLIVVPILDSIGRSPALVRLAGTYHAETERTLRGAAKRVVLAVWPTMKTLAKISSSRPRALCVLQWTEEHTNDWLAAAAARDLSGRAPSLKSATIADPIVRAAAEEMASSINLNNLLYQRDDRDQAILTLRLLHERGRAFDPDELFRWAIATGWPGEGAENLRRFGEEILAGRRHGTTRADFGDDVYRYWERKASE